jgi:hypothetical protein
LVLWRGLFLFGLLDFEVALAGEAKLEGGYKVDEAGRVELPENLLKES